MVAGAARRLGHAETSCGRDPPHRNCRTPSPDVEVCLPCGELAGGRTGAGWPAGEPVNVVTTRLSPSWYTTRISLVAVYDYDARRDCAAHDASAPWPLKGPGTSPVVALVPPRYRSGFQLCPTAVVPNINTRRLTSYATSFWWRNSPCSTSASSASTVKTSSQAP